MKREKAQTQKSNRDGEEQKVCNTCQAPEGATLKHKVCSACKSVFYCSVECQRQDWKNGHRERCKGMQKKAKTGGKK